MGLGEDLQRFAQRTTARAWSFANAVQAVAYDELARRLSERLPDLTPVDTGALARGYTFRIEDGQLIVGNDAFYALAIQRFGGDHDLVGTVVREAETIVNDATYRRTVLDRARARV